MRKQASRCYDTEKWRYVISQDNKNYVSPLTTLEDKKKVSQKSKSINEAFCLVIFLQKKIST